MTAFDALRSRKRILPLAVLAAIVASVVLSLTLCSPPAAELANSIREGDESDGFMIMYELEESERESVLSDQRVVDAVYVFAKSRVATCEQPILGWMKNSYPEEFSASPCKTAVENAVYDAFAEKKEEGFDAAYEAASSLSGYKSELAKIEVSIEDCAVGFTQEEVDAAIGQLGRKTITKNMDGYYSNDENKLQSGTSAYEGAESPSGQSYGKNWSYQSTEIVRASYYGDFAYRRISSSSSIKNNSTGEKTSVNESSDEQVFFKGKRVYGISYNQLNSGSMVMYGEGEYVEADSALKKLKDDGDGFGIHYGNPVPIYP